MKALLIFSGGQDSTTLLGYALQTYESVEAITFDYGQKHSIETQQAKKICEMFNVKQHLIDITFFKSIVDSALTSDGDVNQSHPRLTHLPASYVPNRNAMFNTIAHALAQKIGAEVLISGVCETDYSGYPDCRLQFVQAIQHALELGSETKIRIETPLMFKTKSQTFEMAEDYGFLDIVIEYSHTCYNGNRIKRNVWGYGCGECPACIIRKKGFEEFVLNGR